MSPLAWMQLGRVARGVIDAGARLVRALKRPSSSSSGGSPFPSDAERYIAGRNDERWAQTERERAGRAAGELDAAARKSEAPERPSDE